MNDMTQMARTERMKIILVLVFIFFLFHPSAISGQLLSFVVPCRLSRRHGGTGRKIIFSTQFLAGKYVKADGAFSVVIFPVSIFIRISNWLWDDSLTAIWAKNGFWHIRMAEKYRLFRQRKYTSSNQ
jgi:hypothetical protein